MPFQTFLLWQSSSLLEICVQPSALQLAYHDVTLDYLVVISCCGRHRNLGLHARFLILSQSLLTAVPYLSVLLTNGLIIIFKWIHNTVHFRYRNSHSCVVKKIDPWRTSYKCISATSRMLYRRICNTYQYRILSLAPLRRRVWRRWWCNLRVCQTR